jgi:hypothetical protein
VPLVYPSSTLAGLCSAAVPPAPPPLHLSPALLLQPSTGQHAMLQVGMVMNPLTLSRGGNACPGCGWQGGHASGEVAAAAGVNTSCQLILLVRHLMSPTCWLDTSWHDSYHPVFVCPGCLNSYPGPSGCCGWMSGAFDVLLACVKELGLKLTPQQVVSC